MKKLVMKEPKQLVNPYITKHLDVLNDLSDSVAHLLQVDRNIHTLWISVKRNKLLIMTDNSSFANQLRFQQAIIQQHVNRTLLTKLKSVKIKLMPAPPQPYENTQQKCYRISSSASKILSSMAEGIEDDEIVRLLRNIGKNT
jgi:hypothetical protein